MLKADTTLTLANVVKPTSVSWEQRATSNILKGGTQWRVIQLNDHLESIILSSFTLKKVTGSTVTGLKISVLQTGQCNIFYFHSITSILQSLSLKWEFRSFFLEFESVRTVSRTSGSQDKHSWNKDFYVKPIKYFAVSRKTQNKVWCVGVWRHLRRGQFCPRACKMASVMLPQPDTHRDCRRWQPRQIVMSPSSVICCSQKDTVRVCVWGKWIKSTSTVKCKNMPGKTSVLCSLVDVQKQTVYNLVSKIS